MSGCTWPPPQRVHRLMAKGPRGRQAPSDTTPPGRGRHFGGVPARRGAARGARPRFPLSLHTHRRRPSTSARMSATSGVGGPAASPRGQGPAGTGGPPSSERRRRNMTTTHTRGRGGQEWSESKNESCEPIFHSMFFTYCHPQPPAGAPHGHHAHPHPSPQGWLFRACGTFSQLGVWSCEGSGHTDAHATRARKGEVLVRSLSAPDLSPHNQIHRPPAQRTQQGQKHTHPRTQAQTSHSQPSTGKKGGRGAPCAL